MTTPSDGPTVYIVDGGGVYQDIPFGDAFVYSGGNAHGVGYAPYSPTESWTLQPIHDGGNA